MPGPRIVGSSNGVATVELDDGSLIDVIESEADAALSAARPAVAASIEPLTGGTGAAAMIPDMSAAMRALSGGMTEATAPLYAAPGEAVAPLTPIVAPSPARAPRRPVAAPAAPAAAPEVAPYTSAAGETAMAPVMSTPDTIVRLLESGYELPGGLAVAPAAPREAAPYRGEARGVPGYLAEAPIRGAMAIPPASMVEAPIRGAAATPPAWMAEAGGVAPDLSPRVVYDARTGTYAAPSTDEAASIVESYMSRAPIMEALGGVRGAAAVPGVAVAPGEAPAAAAPTVAPEAAPVVGTTFTRRPVGTTFTRIPAAEAAAAAPVVAAARPAARVPARAAARPAAPTEEERNAAFVDALTRAPRGALAPEVREESPLEAQIRLAREAANLAGRRAEIEGAAYAEQFDAITGAEAARAENERLRQAAAAEGMERYRRAAEAAASVRMDPEGFFHERGIFGTIMAAVSVGLGSLGSQVMGGPNTALQIINDAIGRDIDAQRANIEQGWRGAESQRTLLDMMDDEFSNRDAAIAATRAALLEAAAARVGEQMTGVNTAEARVNGEAMVAELTSAAAAAAAEAQRAEAEAALQRRLLEARARRAEAQAMREERRARGGGVRRVRLPSVADMNRFNMLADSTGVPAGELAVIEGFAPGLAGVERFSREDGEGAARFPTVEQQTQFNALAASTGRNAGDIAAEAGFTGFEGLPRFASPTTSDQSALVSALDAQLSELERLVGAEGEDIPGVGATGALPMRMLSEAGQDVRQQLTAVTEMVGRLHSGGAISDDEFTRFGTILEGAGTDRALRRGISIIRSELRARMTRAVEAPGGVAGAVSRAAAGARRVE